MLRLAGAWSTGPAICSRAPWSQEAVGPRNRAPAEARDIIEAPGQGVTGEVEGHQVTVGGWAYVVRPPSRSGAGAPRSAGPDPRCGASEPTSRWMGAAREWSSTPTGCVPELAGFIAHAPRGWAFAGSSCSRATTRRTRRRSAARSASTRRMATCCREEKVAYRPAADEGGRAGAHGGRRDQRRAGPEHAPRSGIALASGGGGITAEAADAVILADDPTRVAEAIADQPPHAAAGAAEHLGGAGAERRGDGGGELGYIPPVPGALLQEGIDVAVILNALRAAFPPGHIA